MNWTGPSLELYLRPLLLLLLFIYGFIFNINLRRYVMHGNGQPGLLGGRLRLGVPGGGWGRLCEGGRWPPSLPRPPCPPPSPRLLRHRHLRFFLNEQKFNKEKWEIDSIKMMSVGLKKLNLFNESWIRVRKCTRGAAKQYLQVEPDSVS